MPLGQQRPGPLRPQAGVIFPWRKSGAHPEGLLQCHPAAAQGMADLVQVGVFLHMVGKIQVCGIHNGPLVLFRHQPGGRSAAAAAQAAGSQPEELLQVQLQQPRHTERRVGAAGGIQPRLFGALPGLPHGIGQQAQHILFHRIHPDEPVPEQVQDRAGGGKGQPQHFGGDFPRGPHGPGLFRLMDQHLSLIHI